MMMTSLAAYAMNPLTASYRSHYPALAYQRSNPYLEPFPESSLNCKRFPVFGNEARLGNRSWNPAVYAPTYNRFDCHPQEEDGITPWAPLISLVLNKILPPTNHVNQRVDDYQPTTRFRNTTDYQDYDYPTVNRYRTQQGQATLPNCVTPLSDKALIHNEAYNHKANKALQAWRTYLTKYQGKLDTRVGSTEWAKGVGTYLALLNDPEVRALKPKATRTYTKLLKTLQGNEEARIAMKRTSEHTQILAAVDKINPDNANHRIFNDETT